MQKIHQAMLFCGNCKKPTLHNGNQKQINWLMHIALCFVGIGLITLPLAILSKLMTTNIGGKKGMFCSTCGNEV